MRAHELIRKKYVFSECNYDIKTPDGTIVARIEEEPLTKRLQRTPSRQFVLNVICDGRRMIKIVRQRTWCKNRSFIYQYSSEDEELIEMTGSARESTPLFRRGRYILSLAHAPNNDQVSFGYLKGSMLKWRFSSPDDALGARIERDTKACVVTDSDGRMTPKFDSEWILTGTVELYFGHAKSLNERAVLLGCAVMSDCTLQLTCRLLHDDDKFT